MLHFWQGLIAPIQPSNFTITNLTFCQQILVQGNFQVQLSWCLLFDRDVRAMLLIPVASYVQGHHGLVRMGHTRFVQQQEPCPSVPMRLVYYLKINYKISIVVTQTQELYHFHLHHFLCYIALYIRKQITSIIMTFDPKGEVGVAASLY